MFLKTESHSVLDQSDFIGYESHMPRKIIINTIGTLGDLHPMIALAGALKNAGLEPIFATSHDYLPKIRKAGFKAHGVSPRLLDRAATLGFSEEEFMDKVITSQREMMTKFILGPLSETARELEKVMDGAIAVIGGPFSYAGPSWPINTK